MVELDPRRRRLLVPSLCLLPCAWPARRQVLTRAAAGRLSSRGRCGRLGAVLYGTARAPVRHSAAALYSSDESYTYRYRYQQKEAMRHSANKGKDVQSTEGNEFQSGDEVCTQEFRCLSCRDVVFTQKG